MRFEVQRTSWQSGTFEADSEADAIVLAKQKFDRPFSDKRYSYTVSAAPEKLHIASEAPMERAAVVPEERSR